MPLFRRLEPGDPLPRLTLSSLTNPTYQLDLAAGRYMVLCFFHDINHPLAARALATTAARPDLFDDRFASFFGVSSGTPAAPGPEACQSHPRQTLPLGSALYSQPPQQRLHD